MLRTVPYWLFSNLSVWQKILKNQNQETSLSANSHCTGSSVTLDQDANKWPPSNHSPAKPNQTYSPNPSSRSLHLDLHLYLLLHRVWHHDITGFRADSCPSRSNTALSFLPSGLCGAWPPKVPQFELKSLWISPSCRRYDCGQHGVAHMVCAAAVVRFSDVVSYQILSSAVSCASSPWRRCIWYEGGSRPFATGYVTAVPKGSETSWNMQGRWNLYYGIVDDCPPMTESSRKLFHRVGVSGID